MADHATKDDLKLLKNELVGAIESSVGRAVEDLSEIIAGFAQQVDARFNKLESRVDEIDKKYSHLLDTIDSFLGRIDKYETELAVRDAQLERLLAWAHKVSIKTGIPLENL